MEPADVALLGAWREGDREAGSLLFDRWFPLVHRFFRHKVDDDTVVDLIQTTFLACVEGIDEIRDGTSYRAYLLSVARHKLLDHYRAKARATTVPIEESSLSHLDPSPSSLLRRGRAQRLLLEAIRTLPLDLQLLLELHYWEDLRGPELARILDVPEGTVRSRLRRARELLQEEIARRSIPTAELASTDFDSWARAIKETVEL